MSAAPQLIWVDEIYALGIKKIDDQHKQLLNLIAALGQIKDHNPEFINKVLHTLVEYTKNHFSEEEKLLKRIGYPNFDNHTLQHVRFVEQVNRFKADFEKTPDSRMLLDKIVNFLGKWLSAHILVEDKEYANYLFS